MARRVGRFGKARILRTRRRVLGIPPVGQKVKDANVLALRVARLARIVVKAGGWASVENPARSLLWQVPAYVALARIPGMRLVQGDQCLFGNVYRKPT
eukprot:2592257-Lingulodinium_polyedra.AAC.1